MSETQAEANTLQVDLIVREGRRELDAAAFEQAVQSSLPRSRLIGETSGRWMIAHEDFMHTYADGKAAPPLTAVLTPDGLRESEQIDLSQSWNFPDATQVMNEPFERRLVIELMGIAHPASDRVRAFHAGLCAAIEQLDPVAVWSPHSQQLLKPSAVLSNPLAAVVNVRLFNIQDEPGVMVMDTLGLHVLRLPDLQCHFRNIDESRMAGVLYNLAAYIVDAGDIIGDGNTISGVEGTEHWRCQHEMSLIGPERLVLDIHPGKPFAAGTSAAPTRRWFRRT